VPLIKLASQSELPPENEAREFPCGDKMICVANVNGEITALDNVCLHVGGPLGQGVIEGGKLICPWHGWAYDPKTGQLGSSAEHKVQVYSIKVQDGNVLIQL
jgi:nitrite reductase (NADH) small subunit